MKMHDVSEKSENMPISPENYPTLHLKDDKVKELSNYKVGDTCELHIIGKVTAIVESYDKKCNNVTIEVQKVGFDEEYEEPQSEGDKRETARMTKALRYKGGK